MVHNNILGFTNNMIHIYPLGFKISFETRFTIHTLRFLFTTDAGFNYFFGSQLLTRFNRILGSQYVTGLHSNIGSHISYGFQISFGSQHVIGFHAKYGSQFVFGFH